MAEIPAAKMVDITFDIVRGEGRPVVAMSGAFGGPNAAGNVVAHVYFEYPDSPTTAKLTIESSTGSIVSQALPTRKRHFIREVSVTLVMPPDVARAFAQWCNQQADAAEAAGRSDSHPPIAQTSQKAPPNAKI